MPQFTCNTMHKKGFLVSFYATSAEEAFEFAKEQGLTVVSCQLSTQEEVELVKRITTLLKEESFLTKEEEKNLIEAVKDINAELNEAAQEQNQDFLKRAKVIDCLRAIFRPQVPFSPEEEIAEEARCRAIHAIDERLRRAKAFDPRMNIAEYPRM